MWSYLQHTVSRFLGVGREELTASTGATHIVGPDYPVANSMSAMAAFPWVRACVLAIVDDLSGLPLVAIETQPNGTRKQNPSNPVLDMLRRPSSRMTGRRLRRQSLMDFVLTGNAFFYLPDPLGVSRGLSPIVRLHPRLVQPHVDGMGLPVSYEYNGRDTYGIDEVLHVADVSWSDRPNMLLGESAIRSLHEDLTSHKAAKKHAAKSAQRGRPEFLVSPMATSAGVGSFGKNGTTAIAEAFEESLLQGKGVIAINKPLDVTPLQLTARDMEFAEQYEQTVYAILAVFGVPPVRVGLPGANYGTAKTQMRAYWETLQHKAALFDDELSRLTGDSRVRIEHDFSGVDALQVARTERLERVSLWAAMGFDPEEAARHEGFTNPPKLLQAADPADLANRRRPEQAPEEPQGTRRRLDDDLRGYLRLASKRYGAAIQEHGGDPTAFDLAPSEAERLVVVLEPHLHALRARQIAEHLAKQTASAVAEHLARCAVEGVHPIPAVDGLAAFGATRVRQLTAALEAA